MAIKFPKIVELQGILTRFSPREKFIFYGAVTLVSLVLTDRLIISPIYSKIKSLDTQIEEKDAAIRKNMRVLSLKDRIITESQKYASFMGSAKSEEEEVTTLLKEVERLSNGSSIYLIDMKPAGVKGSGRYSVNLSCEAQMEQLVDFMYAVESSDKLLLIEKYQISPKSKESSVAKCSMTITKVILPK
jgi:hypothetical protein